MSEVQIGSTEQLSALVASLHNACSLICLEAYGKVFPVAGNVGIFCQNDQEYERFAGLAEQHTLPSDNPNQKYFELRFPIEVAPAAALPGAHYTHLYIRRPAPDSPERGDIDFVVGPEKFAQMLTDIAHDHGPRGARRYTQYGLDLIELHSTGSVPPLAGLAYVSVLEVAVNMRIRQTI
jgi:hypothetical protein